MSAARLRLRRLRADSMTIGREQAWVQELTASLPEARAIERLTRAPRPVTRVITWELLSDPDRSR
jgi:hypothetical protein